MKHLFTTILALFFTATAFAQNDKVTAAIVAEGKQLYRSEKASWHGTDLFLERFQDQRQNIGGYLSYADNDLTKCIFYSREETPQVLATITFDHSFDQATAEVNNTPRGLTPFETDLYTIRKLALETIHSDTLFKTYENMNLNLVPLISGKEKKVYVLTGPKAAGVVVFGNDYLLTFSKDNKLTGKKRLHNNILPIKYEHEGKPVLTAMHSHLPETGDYITATDICTLMLYQPYANWEQHLVFSKNYISIWDCGKNQLLVLTKKAWERIAKSQEK